MQYKSYLVENDLLNLKEDLVLFYGENLGLINDFKNKIKHFHKLKYEIINLVQEDILINNNILFNEVSNISLFEKKKIFLIEQASDKITDIIEELKTSISDHKIYLFAQILDKKSKLRNFFEKSKEAAIVPCYPDNELTIKKIIQNKLKGFEGLTTINVNLILENTGLDRSKLNNELDKIKIYFSNNIIETQKLEVLLNNKVNDDFNILKDEAMNGNKIKTNRLLAETILDDSKVLFYINIINNRLDKIYKVVSDKNSIEASINNLKPPIFWKDKPSFTTQVKKWTSFKVKKMLEYTYDLEIQIKSMSSIEKKVLIKKLLVDICRMANS